MSRKTPAAFSFCPVTGGTSKENVTLAWNFKSYDECRQHLKEQFESQPPLTSRSRDLAFLTDKLLSTAEQWGIPLPRVMATGLSKARLLVPQARQALQEGDRERLGQLFERGAELSWRQLRRELGTLQRVRVRVQVHGSSSESGAKQTQVAFVADPRVWAMLQRLTRDHIEWIEEVG